MEEASKGINRKLKLMCERSRIALAIPKIEINEPQDDGKTTDQSV